MVNNRLIEAYEYIQRAIAKNPDTNLLIGYLVATLGNFGPVARGQGKARIVSPDALGSCITGRLRQSGARICQRSDLKGHVQFGSELKRPRF